MFQKKISRQSPVGPACLGRPSPTPPPALHLLPHWVRPMGTVSFGSCVTLNLSCGFSGTHGTDKRGHTRRRRLLTAIWRNPRPAGGKELGAWRAAAHGRVCFVAELSVFRVCFLSVKFSLWNSKLIASVAGGKPPVPCSPPPVPCSQPPGGVSTKPLCWLRELQPAALWVLPSCQEFCPLGRGLAWTGATIWVPSSQPRRYERTLLCMSRGGGHRVHEAQPLPPR